jgi:hypothetical protein
VISNGYCQANPKLAGWDNQKWQRRVASITLFVTGAITGAYIQRFGINWPLAISSVIFTVALVPLLIRNKALCRQLMFVCICRFPVDRCWFSKRCYKLFAQCSATQTFMHCFHLGDTAASKMIGV